MSQKRAGENQRLQSQCNDKGSIPLQMDTLAVQPSPHTWKFHARLRFRGKTYFSKTRRELFAQCSPQDPFASSSSIGKGVEESNSALHTVMRESRSFCD